MINGEILGLIGVTISVLGDLIYVTSIFRGRTKPHIFSWFIWGIVTSVVFLAQLAHDGGPGAWVTGFSALFNLAIFVLALFKGEKTITKTDWIYFIMALITIPLWYFAKTPLYSVILIIIIELLGFIPTFRKSYSKPYEEPGSSYVLAGFKHGLASMSLENFSFITAAYPLSHVFVYTGFVMMLLWRRRVLKNKNIRKKDD